MNGYVHALHIEPNNPWALFNRSISYFHLGLYKESVKDLNAAIEMEPTRYEFYGNRAILHRKCGRFKAASVDYASMEKLVTLGEMETCLLPGHRSWVLFDQEEQASAREEPSTELPNPALLPEKLTRAQKIENLYQPNRVEEETVSTDHIAKRKVEKVGGRIKHHTYTALCKPPRMTGEAEDGPIKTRKAQRQRGGIRKIESETSKNAAKVPIMMHLLTLTLNLTLNLNLTLHMMCVGGPDHASPELGEG